MWRKQQDTLMNWEGKYKLWQTGKVLYRKTWLALFNMMHLTEKHINIFLYIATTNDGNYKNTAIADQYNFNSAQFPGEKYYYGQIYTEPSPLNRITAIMSPGLNWVGSNRV